MSREYLIRIWMVRHGQTNWNEQGRCQGSTDLPLSSRGIQAVRTIAECVDVSQCDAVFCSPYKRTIETARLLMVNTSHAPFICEELREIDFGTWEGKPWKNIIENRRAEWNVWKNDPLLSNPYKGESLSNAEERIKRLYSMFLREYLGQTILLVSHGGILNIFLCFLFQLPLRVSWTFKLSAASFSEVLICTYGPVITVLNYGPNISIDRMYIGKVQEGKSQLLKKCAIISNSLPLIQHEILN